MNREKMRDLEFELRQINVSNGFIEKYIPIMENIEIYKDSILDNHLYKCVNHSDVKALRADYTTSIVADFSKRSDVLPKRVAYYGEIFRTDKPKNYRQIGVEYLGGNSKEADLLIMDLIMKYLNTIELKDSVLCINYMPFIKQIIKKMDLDEKEEIEFKNLLLAHNYVEIEKSLNLKLKIEEYDAIWKLFNERNITKILASLKKILPEYKINEGIQELLCHYSDRFVFDIGLVKNLDYYTGLVFEVYVGNKAKPIISGGRYDDLSKKFGSDFPAIGFALDANYLGEI